MVGHAPERMRNFCEECGAAAITECPSCDRSIPGYYLNSAAVGIGYAPPAYCGDCGTAFPWTERRLQAARDLTLEDERLSPEEKAQLTDSLPDLTHDTPQTAVATARVKRLLARAGTETAKGLRDVLVDVVSESVKKAIWGPVA